MTVYSKNNIFTEFYFDDTHGPKYKIYIYFDNT